MDTKEKTPITSIEFELQINSGYGGVVSSFEKVNELLEKICDAHEGKREFRIKIICTTF